MLATAGSGSTAAADGGPVSLWIGDSYTFGAGVPYPWMYGEAWATSRALGWTLELDAEGGTGFVANEFAEPSYVPVPNRLKADASMSPAPTIVVIDAGRNDVGFPWDVVHHVVISYLRAVHKDFPKAAVVVIAPFLMRSKPYDYLAMRCLLGTEAQSYGWAFVDPLQQGWINLHAAKLVGGDGVHPSVQGYEYLVSHLAPALERALASPPHGDPKACRWQWATVHAQPSL